MKAIASAALLALAQGSAIVTGAVAFYTSPEPAFAWGGYGNIEIDGDTYVGIGDYGTVAPLAFEIGGVEGGIQLALAGITPQVLALIRLQNVRGSSVVMRRLIFDETGTELLGAPKFFHGRCDRTPMKDVIGGESEATFEIEGSARGLNRSGARMANHQDQLTINPTDNSFISIATVPLKMLYWMGKPPERVGQAANGGFLGPISSKLFGQPVKLPNLLGLG